MENFKYNSPFSFILLAIAVICQSCDQEIELTEESMDVDFIVGTWRYEEIRAANRVFIWADDNMELKEVKDNAGGDRGELARRLITYFDNNTYQLQWDDRGFYELGTDGHPNFQPSFGSWQLDGSTLIHNPGLEYEQEYTLFQSSTTITRISFRVMSDDSDAGLWQADETIKIEELFKKE